MKRRCVDAVYWLIIVIVLSTCAASLFYLYLNYFGVPALMPVSGWGPINKVVIAAGPVSVSVDEGDGIETTLLAILTVLATYAGIRLINFLFACLPHK